MTRFFQTVTPIALLAIASLAATGLAGCDGAGTSETQASNAGRDATPSQVPIVSNAEQPAPVALSPGATVTFDAPASQPVALMAAPADVASATLAEQPLTPEIHRIPDQTSGS